MSGTKWAARHARKRSRVTVVALAPWGALLLSNVFDMIQDPVPRVETPSSINLPLYGIISSESRYDDISLVAVDVPYFITAL